MNKDKSQTDQNRTLKTNAANLSVVSNVIITSGKLIVGVITASIGIISEAIHSGMDLFAAIVARYSVIEGMKPPDKDHQFGHGKVENVGSLIEAILIFAASILIIYFSVKKIINGTFVQHVSLGIWVMLASALINLFVGLRVRHVARITDSPALEADALHILTDFVCSLGVIVALIIVLVGKKFSVDLSIADPVIAIVIAVYISYLAFLLVKRAANILIDVKLSAKEEKIIINTIRQHYGKILGFHALRTRKAGFTKHIDLHLEVQKDMPVKEAHDLCDEIEKSISENLPGTDILTHVEPCSGACDDCKYLNDICKKV